MSVHATPPFENDDAIDFLIELDDDPSFEALTGAFDAIINIPAAEYLDVDVGACAVAAVEVLARALHGGVAVRPLRARTLASIKKALAEQPAARKAWAIERARTALARAIGPQSELASQWDELSGKKGSWRRDIRRLDKLLVRAHDALTIGLAKKRPQGVPKSAEFDRDELHWQVEPRDARRRLHGSMTYFRPDGSLAATATYERGSLHGPFVRYHESREVSVRGTYERGVDHGVRTYLRSNKPTSELAFNETHDAIVEIECDFVHGRLRTTRWFDADGHLVTPEGECWPPRPASVPAEASFNGREGWVDGGSDEQLARHGTWRFWDRGGTLTNDIVYEHGRVLPKRRPQRRAPNRASRRR